MALSTTDLRKRLESWLDGESIESIDGPVQIGTNNLWVVSTHANGEFNIQYVVSDGSAFQPRIFSSLSGVAELLTANQAATHQSMRAVSEFLIPAVAVMVTVAATFLALAYTPGGLPSRIQNWITNSGNSVSIAAFVAGGLGLVLSIIASWFVVRSAASEDLSVARELHKIEAKLKAPSAG